MEKLNDNSFAMNIILRAVNSTTNNLISIFDGFRVIEIGKYERIPNGPKDRVILFQKNNLY